MTNYKLKNIHSLSVVGLGKLGLCLALAFASRGIQVLGIDINNDLIDSLKNGLPSHHEPLLKNFLKLYKRNIVFTTDYDLAIKNTDVTIVLVPTPSDTYGNFSNKYVESVLTSLAVLLKHYKKEYHLFIISSTLMPGSINERLIPLLEKESGLKLNKDFGVTFVPDFVALGNVINDFLNPNFVLIGEEDKKSGDITESFYRRLVGKSVPISRIPYIDAEISKVALNCYITTKISFANNLANLCEKIPGANIDNVTKTIGQDKRISPYYIKGGLSFGGTCFPRDTMAYLALAQKKHANTELIEAVESINQKTDNHIFDLINVNKNTEIVFLGAAFKKDTSVTEKSLASNIIPRLLRSKRKVYIYDPLAEKEMKTKFGNKIGYLEKKELFLKPRTFVLTIDSKEYKSIFYNKAKEGSVIIDCWRMFTGTKFKKGIKYVPVGVGLVK